MKPDPAQTLGEETAPGEASSCYGRATGVMALLAPFCTQPPNGFSQQRYQPCQRSAGKAQPSPGTAGGSVASWLPSSGPLRCSLQRRWVAECLCMLRLGSSQGARVPPALTGQLLKCQAAVH
ncbi:SRSF protein kinase 2-like [Platysternon megacephalum]|uniref:SRSF protein kinase 2-like n=1 Tax=Platysternon megacephalum TaxID=55544 RepID=A0A4D9DRN6_9SAUR|nr:SRSF protein kinase 2-like [Platysternon megacephalum]